MIFTQENIMKRLDEVKICAAAVVFALCGVLAYAQDLTSHPSISVVASTIPENGDVNPYGLAQIPVSKGVLVEGDFLVSNFNNSANLQGTGTTIVQIAPDGSSSLFAQIDPNHLPGPCTGGVGLSTALGVLKTGWVIVGSLPTSDGTAATAKAGCLLVLDSYGNVVETFVGALINGPWDMAITDYGSTANLFVSNVLNGTVAGGGNVVYGGTVTRLTLIIPEGHMPALLSVTVIGSKFAERTDPAALVIGPTGLGVSGNGRVLYVADSLNNRIAAIENPENRKTSGGIGETVTEGGSLNDPLGLTVAADGNILTVDGDDGYLVATTPEGKEIGKRLLDDTGNPPGNGALFGLATASGGKLYYVDDVSNTLNLFQ
jgi:hypothetical protein